MEFIVNSLKQLASNVSTSDLIVIIALAGMVLYYVVKFVVKYRDIISTLFRSETDKTLQTEISKLNSRFDSIVTIDQIRHEILIDRNDLVRKLSETSDEVTKIQYTLQELDNIKEDLRKHQEDTLKHIDILKQNISTYEHSSETHYNVLLAQLNKNHDAIIQAMSKIEKIDEFVKTAIPEFRTYHRELNNEVRDLNRDVALIGLQASMNSGNAIKLR